MMTAYSYIMLCSKHWSLSSKRSYRWDGTKQYDTIYLTLFHKSWSTFACYI